MRREYVLLSFFALGVGGVVLLVERIRHPLRPMTIEEIRAPLNLSGRVPPTMWATDGGNPDAPPVVALPMPEKPFPNQKTPPCHPRLEVAKNGACWRELVAGPSGEQCGVDAYEKDGKCYLPVRAASKTPVTVGP